MKPSDMKLPELRKHAREVGLKIPPGVKKAELLKMVEIATRKPVVVEPEESVDVKTVSGWREVLSADMPAPVGTEFISAAPEPVREIDFFPESARPAIIQLVERGMTWDIDKKSMCVTFSRNKSTACVNLKVPAQHIIATAQTVFVSESAEASGVVGHSRDLW